MNTPSSIKTKNHLDHIIYMPLFFSCFFFFPPKSARVGLRLPDCTHIYSNKDLSYSIYNLYQGKKEGQGKEEKRGKIYPPTNSPPPTQKKERKKSHNREIYVPSIMEERAPQTDGSAQANVLLVFLRDLF